MHLSQARLLELELDAIHGLETGPGVFPVLGNKDVAAVFAWSPHARLLALNPDLKLDEDPVDPGEPYIPGALPRVVSALAGQLPRADPDRPVQITGGPTFVIPPDVSAPAVRLPILVSDEAGLARAGTLVRPDNWEEDEWQDLTEGRIGEWAMALDADEPVAICHTPAWNAQAAEAGVWTRPDFRGRGLAPAVVVAWARRERANKQVLFYSTWNDNPESQAVARKLALTPLGWLWTVT
jgi:GNAT superfamily N-acetyltransferase